MTLAQSEHTIFISNNITTKTHSMIETRATTSCPQKHEAVSFKIPHVFAPYATDQKSTGRACDWLVARRRS